MSEPNNRWWEQWDKSGIAQFIDNRWTNDDITGFEHLHRQRLSLLVSRYYKPSMKKVLDVGCGTGLIYQALIPGVLKNTQYVGVDVSSEMLNIARARFPSGIFKKGDAFSLDFKDKEFDLILSFEVAIHLPEFDLPISEMLRVAKDMVIMTFWVSEEDQQSKSTIKDAEFIHHFYKHENILSIIHNKAGKRRHRIEVCPVSDLTWAYIVIFGQQGEDQIVPFPGFIQQYLSHACELLLKNRQLLDEQKTIIDLLEASTHLARTEAAENINIISETQKELDCCRQSFLHSQNNLAETRRKLTLADQGFSITRQKLARSEQAFVSLQQKYFKMEVNFLEADKILNSFRLDSITKINNLRRRPRLLQKSIEITKLLLFNQSLEDQISASFQHFRDDSYIFNTGFQGYQLNSSKYLNNYEFIEYQVVFNRANLSRILIAPILFMPATSGVIGIEIVSPEDKIIIHDVFPLNNYVLFSPLSFAFISIPDTNQGKWKLRVFTRDADVSVSVFEWKRINLFVKGFISRKPFFGYGFEK